MHLDPHTEAMVYGVLVSPLKSVIMLSPCHIFLRIIGGVTNSGERVTSELNSYTFDLNTAYRSSIAYSFQGKFAKVSSKRC